MSKRRYKIPVIGVRSHEKNRWKKKQKERQKRRKRWLQITVKEGGLNYFAVRLR